MSIARIMQQAAAGAAGEALAIEDVFSTYLYTGDGVSNADFVINNGIDLQSEGGLVWVKRRDAAENHALTHTGQSLNVNGFYPYLQSQSTGASSASDAYGINAFTNTGFTLRGRSGPTDNEFNSVNSKMASWTFRKAPRFFDVVTWTGTGSARTVSHNLGVVPGCIMVKRTDSTGDWQIYHRSNTAAPETDFLVFTNDATADSNTRWNDTQPTDAVFSLGTEATVNASGGTYVAYLFAHDAGGFGDDGLQNVITCGSYTGNGSATGPTVTLGYEPQWLMVKRATGGLGSWYMWDNMRGFPVDGNDAILFADVSNAETTTVNYIDTSATGFIVKNSNAGVNASGSTYIYIAIRRGPMREPTSGTEVYAPVVYTGTNVDNRLINTGILTDMVMIKERNDTVDGMVTGDRLRGNPYLLTGTTAAENTDADSLMTPTSGVGNAFAAMNGVGVGNDTTSKVNADTTANNHVAWAFRRAPGFFDMVAYTGTDAALTLNHNLGVTPDIWIIKRRSGGTGNWQVGANGHLGGSADSRYIGLDSTAAAQIFANLWATPTSTTFGIGTGAPTSTDINASGSTYIAYLFATLPGVSKVGSYTGNGSSQTINCGFTGGARFVLIKRTDSTGDWLVGDTARGIVAGNDPYIELNEAAAEDTDEDWLDTDNSGFIVNETSTANANVNTATYIYLAIA